MPRNNLFQNRIVKSAKMENGKYFSRVMTEIGPIKNTG